MTRSRIVLPAAGALGLTLLWMVPLAALSQSAAPSGAAPTASAPASARPDATVWGGLRWSAPTAGPDGNVQAVIPFRGSLVAVGSVQGTDGSSAAVWRSPDGTSWQRTALDAGPGDDVGITFVVPTASGLLAVGSAGTERCTGDGEGSTCSPLPVAMWASADGTSWTRVPVPPPFDGTVVTGAASGPDGVIAVGHRGFDQPRLWMSTDGTSWGALHLSKDIFAKAHFLDVASTPAGWLIVGSTGGTPPTGFAISDPNGSRGAAWLSADGQTWKPAHVAGHGPQVELRSVYQGADGLVSLGTREGGQVATVWTSSDGQRWTLAQSATKEIFQPLPMAADGRRIIGDSYVDGDSISFSVSADGNTWRTLANLGDTATMPGWSGVGGRPVADQAVVLPDGVLFLGRGQDGATITWRAIAVPVDAVPQPSLSPSAAV